MKIVLLLMSILIFSCNNESNQKKVYQDSANMFLDSLEKYKPQAEIVDDSLEIIRKGRYQMYLIMYNHYKEKAEN